MCIILDEKRKIEVLALFCIECYSYFSLLLCSILYFSKICIMSLRRVFLDTIHGFGSCIQIFNILSIRAKPIFTIMLICIFCTAKNRLIIFAVFRLL